VRVDRSRLPALGADPTISFPPIEKHTRDHGLELWTVEHRDVPVLCLSLLVPAGSATDPAGKYGLAALTADLMDEGTLDLDGLALHDALARIGAQFECEVGVDATVVTLVTLTRFARDAMALLSAVVNRPRFDDNDFARVREMRVSRLHQLRDVPAAVAERIFAHRLYGPHPYGHTSLGTISALRRLTVDDVRAFHRDALLASPATINVVGDVSHAESMGLLDGAWPERTVPVDATAATASQPTPLSRRPASRSRVALAHRPGAAQSELRIGCVAAARSTPDYVVLAVLNTALGGAFVSRINLKLREEKGFTYGARSAFDYRRQPGPFVVQASVQTDATAEAVQDVLTEIADIAGPRPITAQELTRAQAALTRGYPRNFETADQIARAVAQLALHGLPDDYFDRFVSGVKRVTVEEVVDAARRYLPRDALEVVVVGDRDRIAGPLATLGLGEIELVPPDFEPGDETPAPGV
jgi:zinc protease